MDKDVFLNRGFTFQCPAWKRCKLEHRLLTKVSSCLQSGPSLVVAHKLSAMRDRFAPKG